MGTSCSVCNETQDRSLEVSAEEKIKYMKIMNDKNNYLTKNCNFDEDGMKEFKNEDFKGKANIDKSFDKIELKVEDNFSDDKSEQSIINQHLKNFIERTNKNLGHKSPSFVSYSNSSLPAIQTFRSGQSIGNLKVGTITHQNGDIYEGSILNNKAEGYGMLKFKNGCLYIGEFRKNIQHGKGMEIFVDNSKYEGEFVQGEKCGFGVLTWTDKSKFTGNFLNNQIHGEGRYDWADGKVYEGNFKIGKMDGNGRFFWPNGKQYWGEFKNDNKHGYGVLIDKDQVNYKGKWVDNLKDGEFVVSSGSDSGNNIRKTYFRGKSIDMTRNPDSYRKKIEESTKEK